MIAISLLLIGGINGKSKYPLGGIDVFKLADGSVPSQGVFRQMEALS